MPSVPVSIELLPFPSFKITYDTVFVKIRPPPDDHLVVISMYANCECCDPDSDDTVRRAEAVNVRAAKRPKLH